MSKNNLNNEIAIVWAYINKYHSISPLGNVSEEEANRAFNEICEFIREVTTSKEFKEIVSRA